MNVSSDLRRAEAVKAYLVSKGIAANRIYTEGKGKRQPVKNCTGGMSKALIFQSFVMTGSVREWVA